MKEKSLRNKTASLLCLFLWPKNGVHKETAKFLFFLWFVVSERHLQRKKRTITTTKKVLQRSTHNISVKTDVHGEEIVTSAPSALYRNSPSILFSFRYYVFLCKLKRAHANCEWTTMRIKKKTHTQKNKRKSPYVCNGLVDNIYFIISRCLVWAETKWAPRLLPFTHSLLLPQTTKVHGKWQCELERKHEPTE